jgi:hypothetical protein
MNGVPTPGKAGICSERNCGANATDRPRSSRSRRRRRGRPPVMMKYQEQAPHHVRDQRHREEPRADGGFLGDPRAGSTGSRRSRSGPVSARNICTSGVDAPTRSAARSAAARMATQTHSPRGPLREDADRHRPILPTRSARDRPIRRSSRSPSVRPHDASSSGSGCVGETVPHDEVHPDAREAAGIRRGRARGRPATPSSTCVTA